MERQVSLISCCLFSLTPNLILIAQNFIMLNCCGHSLFSPICLSQFAICLFLSLFCCVSRFVEEKVKKKKPKQKKEKSKKAKKESEKESEKGKQEEEEVLQLDDSPGNCFCKFFIDESAGAFQWVFSGD